MPPTVPTRARVLLFLLFFLGFALNVFTFVDLDWTHWLFEPLARAQHPPDDRSGSAAAASAALPEDEQVKRVRPSIFNLRARQCQGTENTGTAFVVKAGYVATSAHIIGDSQSCGSELRLIDYRGLEHNAQLEGLSTSEDLALLQIADATLPPLTLADPSPYERSLNEVVRLVTIGYPLETAGASAPDGAAISGEGSLSRYDAQQNAFVTSGLNLNPGNSGGPVFLYKNWHVLGIARSKLRPDVGEGIGYVVSIKTFKNFFREKTGQELP